MKGMNPPKPSCTACDADSKTYQVTQGMSTTTLMGFPSPYWNEAGKFIVPRNPNRTTTSYICSNGHTWVMSS